ncbi:MAG: DUF2169 domain-containing protein [Lysobacterales bacterium]
MPNKAPPNLRLVCGQPYKDYELALVMKLTFSITANGECVPAKVQQPIIVDPVSYEAAKPPLVSPPSWDSDLMAFKAGTDVVVQGHAYSYGQAAQTVDTELSLPDVSRIVRVHGDRRLDWRAGNPVFTAAEPFELMQLRYDRAYGGCDQFNLAKVTDLLMRELIQTQPELHLDAASESHYPRNPTGRGFLIDMNRQSSEDMLLPNLEFPFDPITPERLAVGSTGNWMSAPLPAAFDWIDPAWFPRIAYLGLTPEHIVPADGVQEIALGWATPGLMKLKAISKGGWHPTFQHGASPGLVLRRLQPGTQMLLKNMFPQHPERKLQLSSKVPQVEIGITETTRLAATSYLNAVVIQPDQDQVVEVWSARAKVTRPFAQNELDNMNWKIGWK